MLIGTAILERIQHHAEKAYPEEGAGFLLGSCSADGNTRQVAELSVLKNAREPDARGNRYLITPEDYLDVELEAAERGLELIGVFHSHPDHPDRPSDFDREWAQPYFSYLITSVVAGAARGSRAWRLSEHRTEFTEEEIRFDGIS